MFISLIHIIKTSIIKLFNKHHKPKIALPKKKLRELINMFYYRTTVLPFDFGFAAFAKFGSGDGAPQPNMGFP